LIRYCDDFVCCFQNIWEAEEFYKELNIRFDKYSLELAMDKTRILEFGRFAEKRRTVQGYRKAETFDFLGFTFYCSHDRKKEYFRCKVKTSKKKFRKKVKEMSQWIKDHRNLPVGEIIKGVNTRLRGHYQYYCVNDNQYETHKFFFRIKWILFYWLNRRSEKRSYTWDEFYNGLLRTLPLIVPSLKVSLFKQKPNMI
ncbi:MAG: RNA-directed polymerase, partial [Neobacillus sp.]|nr:RNA-directed polymerase [Neobacillus sp.]